MLASCSKIDNSQRTAPADYAETERQLIQNREHDSLRGDSINASTEMPPQPVTEQNRNQSGLKPPAFGKDTVQ
ncbi:MAG TPA: hypothetical protein DCL65_06285 [Chryseobacterium sp.]|nr:hypothetical protein [Kaistella sp.]HAI80625.1 hypothetical protein [Chryseobacterium sp.]